jgi:hypothetical protein
MSCGDVAEPFVGGPPRVQEPEKLAVGDKRGEVDSRSGLVCSEVHEVVPEPVRCSGGRAGGRRWEGLMGESRSFM